MFLLIGAAVVARVGLAWSAPASYDMNWYWSPIASGMEQGVRLYEQTPYHFGPPWAWLLLLFQRLSHFGVPFDASLRTFLAGVDFASAWLLFRIAGRLGDPGRAWRAPLLFLANPVSIWVSSVQGQFDNFALLFLLAAVLVSEQPDGAARRAGVRTGLLLLLSVAVKQVGVFHPLLWLRRRQGPWIVAMAYLGSGLLFLPYAAQWRAILDKILFYGSVPRSYGFSELVLYDARFAPIVGAVGAAVALAAAWVLGKYPLSRSCLVLFLVILIFAPGLGAQYLVWPVTFGSLFGGGRYVLFTATSLAWILGSHYGVIGSGRWMGHLVWLSVGLWLAGEIRELARMSAVETPKRRNEQVSSKVGGSSPR